jgi:hypothetical protein
MFHSVVAISSFHEEGVGCRHVTAGPFLCWIPRNFFKKWASRTAECNKKASRMQEGQVAPAPIGWNGGVAKNYTCKNICHSLHMVCVCVCVGEFFLASFDVLQKQYVDYATNVARRK